MGTGRPIASCGIRSSWAYAKQAGSEGEAGVTKATGRSSPYYIGLVNKVPRQTDFGPPNKYRVLQVHLLLTNPRR